MSSNNKKQTLLKALPSTNANKGTGMDLNEMVLFTHVVESGGFTPAAKKSGVPLSTVSRKMTNLEERLGVRLIQRSTRHIHLTELGEQYYVHCREMLDAALRADEVVQNASSEPSGTLKLATPISMDSKFTSQLLSGYLNRYRKMNVQVHRYIDDLALIDDGYDCAIVLGKVPDSNNVIRVLGSDKLILCASKQYLEAFGEPLTIDDLEKHIGLKYEVLPFVCDTDDGKVPFPLPARYAGNDPIMLKRLAIDGVGICFLPKGGLLDALEEGELVQVLPSVECTIEMSLLYPGKKNFSPKLDSFIEYLLSAIEQGDVPWDQGR